jgi:homoserine dehydrogenase
MNVQSNTKSHNELHLENISNASTIRQIKVGLVGLGTVGKGTIEVLCRNQHEITRRTGVHIVVTDIASRDSEKTQAIIDAMDCTYRPNVHKNAMDVANADIDVLVELIGGCTIAKDVIMQAIHNKKHIVTANKALIANHAHEIFALAQQQHVLVGFEAAVAGGVPIIKALREGLSANRITWLAGIINGTTNFILSSMAQKGLSFTDALLQAQEMGYAEADPTFDIEGIDAAHKISIIASLAFGIPVQFSKAYIEGITHLHSCDIEYASELGYNIKLLGIAKHINTNNENNENNLSGIELRVHPVLLPKHHILANVHGAMNAVMVHGDAVGETLYYGKGAGSEATASAVIADLVDVVRNINNNMAGRVPPLAFQQNQLTSTPVLNIADIHTRYYLRLKVIDQSGVMANITSALAQKNISIKALLQKESMCQEAVDIIILTDITKEVFIDEALHSIRQKIQPIDTVKIRLEFL